MKLKTDLDYVIFYSEQLKKNALFFEQQKKFLESQIKASKSIFANWKGEDFKKKARAYLNSRGLIKNQK